jgi:peptidoglycan/xylan/chitin deacetylase (PgdA/CDA1 family)
MYHRIGEAADERERKYCVPAAQFAGHMRALANQGLRAYALDEFLRWLANDGALGDDGFLLTFDDGFRGVYEHAAPLLAEFGWPATMFLVSAFVGGVDAWTTRDDPARRTHPLLGRGEITSLARQGFAFHSHSRHHEDLTTLADDALRDELVGSRRELEDLLGTTVTSLAYPYGRCDDRVVEATRAAGYTTAFSVQPGFNRRSVDRYRIRRLDVFGTDTPGQLLRKIRFGSNDGSLANAVRYYAGRVAERAGMRRDAAGR